jgi:hypothetical protein
MDDFLDILKYIIPSGVVFATAYYLLKVMLDNEQRKRLMEIKLKNQTAVTPVRLQAYERIVLFLERISPNNLIFRVYDADFSASQFQTILTQAIRDEYEHNLSQQLYISSPAWDMVKNAKEEMIKMINVAAVQLSADANATELSGKIFAMSSEINQLPVNKAIEVLKNEVRQLF